MLILASLSPRRKELLRKITTDFVVMPANIDERALDLLSPKDLPLEESRMKAYEVFSSHPFDRVLASDTVVILDNEVLGKPKDEKDAFCMLNRQSGNRQVVLTGYTYIDENREITRSVKTFVYFNVLSDQQIIDYVNKYKPLDKAGAYGIQDEAGLINRIEGSYDNVMGFPTEDIKAHVFNNLFTK